MSLLTDIEERKKYYEEFLELYGNSSNRKFSIVAIIKHALLTLVLFEKAINYLRDEIILNQNKINTIDENLKQLVTTLKNKNII